MALLRPLPEALEDGLAPHDAFAILLGGILSFFALDRAHDRIPVIVTPAASSFLYVAIADLMPRLERESDSIFWHAALLAAGIAVVALSGAHAHRGWRWGLTTESTERNLKLQRAFGDFAGRRRRARPANSLKPRHSGLDPESRIVKFRRKAPQEFLFPVS
jgi:hypothetical protein